LGRPKSATYPDFIAGAPRGLRRRAALVLGSWSVVRPVVHDPRPSAGPGTMDQGRTTHQGL